MPKSIILVGYPLGKLVLTLQNITSTQLAQWAQLAQSQTQGRVLHRIAPLAEANPCWFAVQICGESELAYGDTDCRFPLMSVVKPFLLLFLLDYHGLESVITMGGHSTF